MANTLEEALYSSLTTHVGLSALVSTRIYPSKLPQAPSVPAIAYRRISRATVHNKPNDDYNTVMARMQFDVYALTYSAARGAVQQLKDAIGDFTNASGPQVYDSRVDDENDLPWDDDTKLYGIAVDALICMQENL